MKKDTLNKAFGEIDDDLLRSADLIVPDLSQSSAHKTAFWRAAAISAVFLLALSTTVFALIMAKNAGPVLNGAGDSGTESSAQSGEDSAGCEKKHTLYLGPAEYAVGRVIEGDVEEYLGEELEASTSDISADPSDSYCNKVNNVSPEVAVAGMNSIGEYVWYICTSYVPPTLGDYLADLGLNAAGLSARNYGMDVTDMLNMQLETAYSAELAESYGDTGPVLYVYDAAIGPVEGQIIFTRYNYVLTDFMGDKRVFLREGGVMDLMSEKSGKDGNTEETSDYFGPDHQTAEFLEAFEKSGIRKWNGIDYCVNTTPEWMYERTGAQRFSLSVTDGTYIWLDGEVYDLGGQSICKTFTAMYPCDYDNDGVTDILYHFLYGSGIDGWHCGVFNTKTKTDTLLDIRYIGPGSAVRLIEVKSLSDGVLRTEYCLALSAGFVTGSPSYCDGYVCGTVVSDPSSPGGAAFRQCEPYQIVDLKNYWSKLKSAAKKEYFTLEELYAGCVRLYAERSLIDLGRPLDTDVAADGSLYLYADEVTIPKNLFTVLERTMIFSFEKYSYLKTQERSDSYGSAEIACCYGEAIGDIPAGERSVAVSGVPHMTVDLLNGKIYGEDPGTDLAPVYAQKYPLSAFIPKERPTDVFSEDPAKRK